VSERRLVLRYRAPDALHNDVAEYSLGETRPPYLVILKGVGTHLATQAVRALSETHGRRLDGSPVLCLPEGAEFELWEVEP